MKKGTVLVVDDEESLRETLSADLGRQGWSVIDVRDAAGALQALTETQPDVALVDMKLGREDGLALTRRMSEVRPDVPVLMMTGFGSMDAAVGAIRAGAYDFINKPVDPVALDIALGRALNHKELSDEVHRLRERSPEAPSSSSPIFGESNAVERVRDMVERIAPTGASVLITGESGTGKELIAQALHDNSGREGRFIAVNCAAMPASLLESELFGHKRGAFTDAKSDRDGLFVQADGGTLLLDEIGEMPLEMQPKLLRALEEQTVRPVGGSQDVSFDVRVVAATNRDLEKDVADGHFREDLFWRVNVVRIDSPPLRERGNDVLVLAQRFLEHFAVETGRDVTGITAPAAQKLLDYDWPGNVRELVNCMQRAVALTAYDQITVDDLPQSLRSHHSTRTEPIGDEDPSQLLTLAEVERRYVEKVLDMLEGNKSRAAKALGIDRRTLYRKLDRFEKDDRKAEES